MRYQSFIYAALLSIALPLFTGAEHHGPSHRRHNALAHRKRTELELQEFHKRDNNARATFYDVGLGACGITNVPSDFIVALNSCEYGGGSPGPNCFKMITIEYQGKQAQAQITDECPGCSCGDLDLSVGLFTFFAPESVGEFYMNWWYNAGGGSPAPSPSPKPKPTSTWVPPPPTTSSTWVDPSPWTSQTSSTWSQSSSTSTWSSSSWSSSSTSWNSTSWTSSHSGTGSSTATSYTPAATAASAAGNLHSANSLVAQLGQLVVQYGS